MPIQIPNHAHCVICSRAVTYGDKTCSTDCEAKLQDLNRRRRRTLWLLYGLMALSVVVLLFSFSGYLGG